MAQTHFLVQFFNVLPNWPRALPSFALIFQAHMLCIILTHLAFSFICITEEKEVDISLDKEIGKNFQLPFYSFLKPFTLTILVVLCQKYPMIFLSALKFEIFKNFYRVVLII